MRPKSNFNGHGNPILTYMILLSGIKHCKFRVDQRRKNRYAMVYAFMQLVTSNRTPK